MSGWTVFRRVMSARSKARVLQGKTRPTRYAGRVIVSKLAARFVK